MEMLLVNRLHYSRQLRCMYMIPYAFQVYKCLQPLMISLSHRGTLKLIDRLAADYDADLLKWKKHLEESMEVQKV